ncbi:adenine phosphoribosyltransferase [Leptolyngbya sp. FACHB-261]|uniref:adenine phosphoribosyltransferase n=1 Tax=Leptolyngbya sp. FACHB-261 TaxID=2692806 RepID=UPI0016879626|nr:adenine phosphoribosyltransferase [Leptolyngbya sp. FACHB-261]MBD2099678.1 adenine phosphoribosyltransferase [Leptolyngbya sp. FACHB-261]
MDLQALVRDIPDFPKAGILFRDITTLLRDAKGLRQLVNDLAQAFEGQKIDYVVGAESRGFIVGAPLAYCLGAGFVPVRKPGKLPGAVYSYEYALEYGTDRLEMHQDAFEPDSQVLVVDDLIATGGTALATAKLVERAGGRLVGFGFIIELSALDGRKQLPAQVPIVSLITY